MLPAGDNSRWATLFTPSTIAASTTTDHENIHGLPVREKSKRRVDFLPPRIVHRVPCPTAEYSSELAVMGVHCWDCRRQTSK